MRTIEIFASTRRNWQVTCCGTSSSLTGMIERLGRVLIVLAVLLSAQGVPAAYARTITVCEGGGCDYTTIQAAVDSPFTDAGDTIIIESEIHTEAGIVVGKSVSIVGAELSGTIVQAHAEENSAGDRVFEIEAGADVALRRLKIRHGKVTGGLAQGGGILNAGTLTLEQSTVTANLAVGLDGSPVGGASSGGGIYNSGSLTVIRSTIGGNVARGGNGSVGDADGGDALGGGIANNEGGDLTAVNSTISGNSAEYGDGYG